jgi:aryl-alcohol dehydrogenase-like predicted oxidoreductase
MKVNSKQFGLNRRSFLKIGSTAFVSIPVLPGLVRKPEVRILDTKPGAVPQEWRNKQQGMAYRQLGRTGMMISEVVSGGDPIRLDNYKHLNLAVEMGLNYLDMAPAYGRGECEEAYGKFLKESGMRDKLFLNTKISGFGRVRNNLYKDILKGLPSGKQEAIQKKALEMREKRGVDKPGYFFTYWNGQRQHYDDTYISNAMMEDYAHKVEESPDFQKFFIETLEGSLKRVGTDYFDLLMCPHGSYAPEEVQVPGIFQAFEKLKKEGKVRFLGFSSHSDPTGSLVAAYEGGHYDAAMLSYNIANGGYLDFAIQEAHRKGMGLIGMKVAMAVSNHHGIPIPEWRVQKLHSMIPGDMKAPMKAYLWALQNPNLTAVISNLWDETYIRENLSLAGKKVELIEV